MAKSTGSLFVLRFRQLASRASMPLIYVWGGVMLFGLGVIYYKQKKGEMVRCKTHYKSCTGHCVFIFSLFCPVDTRDDLQPDEEFSRKMLYWMERLGLDKVRLIMYRIIIVIWDTMHSNHIARIKL